MATPPPPPPPPPPDARAFVATTAVTIDAQTPYKMDVPIRLVFETLPRFIFVFPLQLFIAGLWGSARVVREAEGNRSAAPAATARACPRAIRDRVHRKERIHVVDVGRRDSGSPHAAGPDRISVLAQDDGELAGTVRRERHLVDAVVHLLHGKVHLRILPVAYGGGHLVEGLRKLGPPVADREPQLRGLA